MIPRTNRGLVRSLLHRIADAMGYRVSGNHVFTGAGYELVTRGRFASSVSERPALHHPRIVRLADILQRTYS